MTSVIRKRLPYAALLLAISTASCGGTTPETPGTPAVTTNPVDPATAGTISGGIRLEGTPPPSEPISLATDAYCMDNGGPTSRADVIANNGALQDVFVYVKDGLGNLKFPVPQTPVVLDQKSCTYRPHVFGVQVGQPMEILNSDSTLHNIHAVPVNNREFNRGQNLQGIKHTHTFTTAEVMVPFKCDVHRWMSAFVGVVEHPFYAVSGADGAFELKGLPPGTYTIEAWHEKLGTQTQSVTIGPKETKSISFSFKV
jgi:plastocyanin